MASGETSAESANYLQTVLDVKSSSDFEQLAPLPTNIVPSASCVGVLNDELMMLVETSPGGGISRLFNRTGK